MKKTKKATIQVGLFALAILTLTSTNIQAQKKMTKMNATITMLATFNIKPEQLEVFKIALTEDAQNARNESGNVTMELYQHKDRPNTLYFFERWTNQKALDEHFEKPYTKKVLELNKTALASPMEILYLSDIASLPKAELKKPLSADNPVDLVVIFKVKDGMQEQFIKQFQKSVKNSRPETGNIAFHFHTVEQDSTKFILYERWRNQAALDFHFEQPYTKELFELFKTVLDKPVDESLNFIIEVGYLKRSDK
jgi:quinol monooxygenase YgiN